MRIAVVGVGGVGGSLGARLAQAGEDVVFIARGEHLRALQTQGLRMDSASGESVLVPVQARNDPAQVGVVDAVLVAVKAWQVPEVAEIIRPLLGPDTCVVPLQNGVEAPDQLAAVLGANHVVGGLCGMVSFVLGPGHIKSFGPGVVRFGELDNHPSKRLEDLRQAFTRARVTVEIPKDIWSALWMKLLLITPWSGLGALTRSPIGIWRSVPETRRLSEQIIHEVLAVAHARGIALPDDALEKTVSALDAVAPEATASMQRDITAGRPSELDAQIGVVVRLGRAAGVEAPTHGFIYGCLLPQEMRARGQLQFAG